MAGELPGSAFVGRADELRRLDAVLDRAGQGHPQVVLVAGDAGVGKTRLLLALADRARRRGMRVLMGASVELGDIGLPYLPWSTPYASSPTTRRRPGCWPARP